MADSSEWDIYGLANAGRAIAAAASDPTELAEATYLEIARLVSADFFQLGVFEEDQYRTLILIQDGSHSENQTFKLDPQKENIIGWVRRTGNPLLVNDFRKEQARLPAQPSYESQDPPVSGLFIPLRVSNTTLGIIALQSRESEAFSSEHVHLFSILGQSIASALTHLMSRLETEDLTLHLVLIQEVSRQLMSLDPLNDRLNRVVGLIQEVFGYIQVRIFEVVEDQINLLTLPKDPLAPNADAVVPETVRQCVDQGAWISAAAREQEGEGGDVATFEYALPLNVVDHVLGSLSIETRTPISQEGDEGSILGMLANQLGFAMLEARNYDERQEEAWMTTVLLEVAKHAAQPGDMFLALQAVLQLSTLLAGTDWALLLTPEENGDFLKLAVHAGFRRQQALSLEEVQISKGEFDLSLPYSENEIPTRISLPETLSGLLNQTHALCLKLSDGTNLLALLLLQDNPLPGIRPSLLAGIGHQVSLRLENARLIEEATLRRSLERELAMARNIQSSFLPESMPEVAGWELGSAWEVAREVGGDFYDIIPLPAGAHGERWGVVIADVADKGIPAALYMALCRTMIRSVAQSHIFPGRTLEIVNQQLITDTRADLFVSLFYAVWEPEAAKLTYANAGHLPPYFFKQDHRAELIREHGMVLGVMPDARYTDQTLIFAPGDLLVLYTDGVNEAHDDDGELFGFQRIENLILALQDKRADLVASAIVDRVVNFSGGGEFYDDLTTVTIRRKP